MASERVLLETGMLVDCGTCREAVRELTAEDELGIARFRRNEDEWWAARQRELEEIDARGGAITDVDTWVQASLLQMRIGRASKRTYRLPCRRAAR